MTTSRPSQSVAEQAREALEGLRDLPTLPEVAVTIIKMADSDDVSLSDLARVIESDPPLTSKILRLANASRAGGFSDIATVSRAVSVMGPASVRSAVLSIGVFQAMGGDQEIPDHKPLWVHSLAVASGSAELARLTHRADPESAFAAGLLHDIGKIALAALRNADYTALADRARAERKAVEDVERDTLGMDHIECGRILIRRWGLPIILENVIRCHEPFTERSFLEADERDVVEIVQMAGALAAEQNFDAGFPGVGPDVDALSIELDFDAEVLAEVRAELASAIETRSRILGLEVDERELYYDAVQKANRALGSLYQEVDGTRRALERKLGHFAGMHSAHQALTPVKSLTGVLEVLVAKACEIFELSRAIIYYRPPGQEQVSALLCTQEEAPRNVSFKVTCEDAGAPQVVAREILKRLLGVEAEFAGERFTLVPMRLRTQGIGGLAACGEDILDDPEFVSLAEVEAFVDLAALAIDRTRLTERLDTALDKALTAQREKNRLEKEIREAEKLAALGRMAAGAAHEMNNPLAIISGRAQMLHRKEDNVRRQKALATIIEQCERLSRIITDLLGYARPPNPRPEPVRVADFLGELEREHQAAFAAAGVTLAVTVNPGAPESFVADKEQIEQVLVNLLVNGRQAVEDKGEGGRVELVARDHGGGRRVLFEITDTGIGIRSEEVARIFEPFYSTKEAGRGTGLGLPITASIVAAHDGFIRTESKHGQGTTIRVYLPVEGPTGEECDTPSPEVT